MELFSPAWFTALGAIILIDLVLAGDNALVIGMAASKLEPTLRKRAIMWGAFGAIAVRGVMALAVVWLLKIPGLLILGGLLLLPIAYKLAVPKEGGDESHGEAATTFWGAMRTIVIADALMGIDNVLGIGGAAQGRMDLVIIGLAITIPLVVWGSSFVANAVVRFPLLIPIGAAVLAVTGAGMIVKDPMFDLYVIDSIQFDWAAKVIAAIVMFAIGYRQFKRNQAKAA
jgi:YjbE family integral membrane protein